MLSTIHPGLPAGDDLMATAQRLTRSAYATQGVFHDTAGFHAWLAHRAAVNRFRVSPVPFADLADWRFLPDSGDLAHVSGRFFTVQGLEVGTNAGTKPVWSQPIINQPEIGVVGILVKEFDGVLHCLMQAKMEPGNVNTLQLSPTVQATRSNYTRVHNGNPTPYLEYFMAPRRGRVVVDALQSEQGAWFLHKRNRNMVIEVDEDVPVLDDFCWLTVGQVHELLRVDNLVNMDARTVLSGLPFAAPDGTARQPGGDDPFRGALVRSVAGDRALHPMAEVLSWFVEAKTRYELRQRIVPLAELTDWRRTPYEISHVDGRYFRVVGVAVEASNREVATWTQPLVAPVGHGVSAFLTRQLDGVLHLLIQARVEAGTLDVVEIAPTVHCLPGNYRDVPPEHRPPYLDYVTGVDRARIRYDVLQSEEGGRFYHAQNRYLMVEVEDDFPMEVPDRYRWVTVHQLLGLLRLSNYVNVEARSLVACLQTLW